MKKFVTYIILIFAFSAFFVGCNSAKKCGCPTFGQKDLHVNTMACETTDMQKMN